MMDPWRPVKPRKPSPVQEHPSSIDNSSQHAPQSPQPASTSETTRQVPLGVGTAPRPLKPSSIPRPQQKLASTAKPSVSGDFKQDFKFPQAPADSPKSLQAKSAQEDGQRSGRKVSVPDPQPSFLNVSPVWPTPKSKTTQWPSPSIDRYSASIYPETEAPISPRLYDESRGTFRFSNKSKLQQVHTNSMLQGATPESVRPSLITIKSNRSKLDSVEDLSSPVSDAASVNALKAAVAAGMSSKPLSTRSATPSSMQGRKTPLRMPFGDGSVPGSPSNQGDDVEPPHFPQSATNRSKMQTPSSNKSMNSTHPLLGLGIDQPAMSSKIPANKRPAQLDLGVVKENEQRSSTASLAELIKRATKLAANLDKGKTASRFDMYGTKSGMKGRQSTMSDMISSFPAPAAGTPRPTTMHTLWPRGEKGMGFQATEEKVPEKQRRYCGMSRPVFIAVLVLVIFLVIAAIVIPIILVALPKSRQQPNGLGNCAVTYPCMNGGTSMVSNNACNCVCSNGFIGSHCDIPGSTTDCATTTVEDGAIEYRNATMGTSIIPLLSSSQNNFSIPLNSSILLSLFASTNLSCIIENQLVDIGVSSIAKRFIILPGLAQDGQGSKAVPVPPRISAAPIVQPLEARDDPVGTSNGIVFQAPSTTANVPIATSSANSAGSTAISNQTATATSSSNPASTSTADVQITQEQLNFARIVVLYVLEQSTTISIAVNAQQHLEEFFSGGNSSQKVDVGYGKLKVTADFAKFVIENGDGTVVGRKSG